MTLQASLRVQHDWLFNRQFAPCADAFTHFLTELWSGEAFSVIALWLEHESMSTTQQYVEADSAIKQKALARL